MESERTAAQRRSAARRRTGRWGEALVAERLTAAGWQILARNVPAGRAELDIVAVDPGSPASLVVVEVRANRSSSFGRPEESVDRDKVRAVYRGALALRTAGVLRDGTPLPHLPLRVDVVAVEVGPRLGEDGGGTVMRHIRGVIG